MAVYDVTSGERITAFEDFCRLYGICGTQNSGIKINTLPDGTVQATAGQTTLDKLLNALTTNLAIIKGRGYIPTTQQPVDYSALALAQQPYLNPAINPNLGSGNTGATFGATLEQFVANNTGLLLVLGAGIVLWKSGRK